jgi:alpha-ribazole phosphatase
MPDPSLRPAATSPNATLGAPPTPAEAAHTQTRIYLARHAEPEGAAGVHRFLGQLDPPLSAAGWRQAGELAQRLKGVSFRAIYSSDLQRSLSTAEAVAVGTDLVIQQEPALREIHAGLWEGLTFAEAKLRYPTEFTERERDLIAFRYPGGGESFRDLEIRVAPVFSQMMDSGPGDMLVVAHKGVNRVMLAHFLGMPRERMFEIAQDYCALSIIQASLLPDGSRAITVDLQNGIP